MYCYNNHATQYNIIILLYNPNRVSGLSPTSLTSFNTKIIAYRALHAKTQENVKQYMVQQSESTGSLVGRCIFRLETFVATCPPYIPSMVLTDTIPFSLTSPVK